MIQNGRAENNRTLPPNWERAYDERSNRHFYVDHNTQTTSWLHPCDKDTKPKSPAECSGDELPYGWEKIDDPIVGVYYVNHLERKNQWSCPVTEWHRSNKPNNSISQHELLVIMDNNFGRKSSQSVEV